MELLIIQDYLRCGGTEKHSLFLLDYCNNQGYETEILTFRPGGVLIQNQSHSKINSLQKRDYKMDWFAPGLLKVIGKKSPKTILCMGRMANCFAGFMQDKFPNINIITTVRTGKHLPRLYRWSVKKSKKVLVNAQWWKDELILSGLNADKIDVVHNPLLTQLNQSECHTLGLTLRNHKKTTPDTCVFLCVQGFRKGKQHDQLIKTFGMLSKNIPWELWLVGEGSERKKCEKLVLQLGIEDKVSFFGYQEDLRAFYGAADVAVSCSKEDSLPNFLIEAQSLQVPVIAWNTKGTQETFIDSETGMLIRDCTIDSTLKACEFMISQPKQRKSMGDKGSVNCKEKFNTEIQARKTLSLIQGIR